MLGNTKKLDIIVNGFRVSDDFATFGQLDSSLILGLLMFEDPCNECSEREDNKQCAKYNANYHPLPT